jgi:hypothetical protein
MGTIFVNTVTENTVIEIVMMTAGIIGIETMITADDRMRDSLTTRTADRVQRTD